MKHNKIIMAMIIVVIAIIIVISIILAYLLKYIKNSEVDTTNISSVDANIDTSNNITTDVNENINTEDQNVMTNTEIDNNSGKSSKINDEDKAHIASLYETYKHNMLNAPKEIYDRLDATYKERRFSTEEKFKEYLTNVADYIPEWQISKFKKQLKGDYTQYVILDEDDNYIYINEKSEQEYTYILDNHTLDTEEFTQRYDSASRQEKVEKNCDKIIDAMNTLDYEYIYNKLDSTFKQKNFNTLDAFKNYFNENLSFVEESSYGEYSEKGEISIKNVAIDEYENMKIEMKLLDNRDFCMIFSIQHYEPAE